MIRPTRVAASFAATAAAATLFSAAPALAQSTSPAPSDETVASFCPEGTVPGSQQPDGSFVFGVEANGAGCVVVETIPQGIGLVQIIVAPGWTAALSGGGGHGGTPSGKVDVKFEQTATGDRVEVRVEPGKTEVK